jgi:hypothetical protein
VPFGPKSCGIRDTRRTGFDPVPRPTMSSRRVGSGERSGHGSAPVAGAGLAQAGLGAVVAHRDIGAEPNESLMPAAAVRRGDFDFPAVPLDEHRPYDRIRELYLYEEPALLAAIGHGDRGEAIRIVNYLLVHIYSVGQERSDLFKGLLLELVVMMSRAAVAGGSPRQRCSGSTTGV